MSDFTRDPGYQFRQQEGQRGVENSAAARGGILSGGALKAISRYNQDFASAFTDIEMRKRLRLS